MYMYHLYVCIYMKQYIHTIILMANESDAVLYRF